MFDKSVTLEEKVGQLFLISHAEKSMTGHVMNMISNHHIGGILLKNDTFEGPKHLFHLTNYLQSYAGNDRPLWIGMQHENSSLTVKGMTSMPAEEMIVSFNNRLYTKQLAEMHGEEMYEVGLNFTIAPHIDFSAVEHQEFMYNFRTKAQHAVATVQGYHQASIEAFAPVHPMLSQIYLNKATAKGSIMLYAQKFFDHATAVLLSHHDIRNPLITNILADHVHYDGVMLVDLSDTSNHTVDVIHAFKQGAHAILLNEDTNAQLRVIQDIVSAVKDGILTEFEIDEAFLRVKEWKKAKQLKTLEHFDRDAFQKKHHQYLIDKVLTAPMIE